VNPLTDSTVVGAVTKLKQRAERETDQQKLLQSFVDSGLKPLLENANNQIIYGRRGTGKTHLLKVLDLSGSAKAAVKVYIDARTLGSTSQFSDSSQPLAKRCLSLFRDIFTEIYNSLMPVIFDGPMKEPDRALELLDELMLAVTEPTTSVKAVGAEEISKKVGKTSSSLGATLSEKPALSAKAAISGGNSLSSKTLYEIETRDKIIFPDLQECLRRLLGTMDIQLLLLLDEWSSIPIDLQPYLAEFLKRSLLPNSAITLKIASLEYRSQFSLRDASGNIRAPR